MSRAAPRRISASGARPALNTGLSRDRIITDDHYGHKATEPGLDGKYFVAEVHRFETEIRKEERSVVVCLPPPRQDLTVFCHWKHVDVPLER